MHIFFFFFLKTHYVHSAPYVETWYAFSKRLRIQGGGTVNRPAPRIDKMEWNEMKWNEVEREIFSPSSCAYAYDTVPTLPLNTVL